MSSRPLRDRPIRIGLTGPIGCGKTAIARWLAARGAAVIDADALARDVTELPDVQRAIFERFGLDMRGPDGTLDRAALAQLAFSDPKRLEELERLTHPLVRERIVAAVADAEAAGAPALVIEAIKLVEGGYARECDEVWLVRCEPAVQRRRLVERGMEPGDVARRIRAQGDLGARLAAAASRILDTSGSASETETLVAAAFAEALVRS